MLYDCKEIPHPLISVSLIKEGEDVQFNDAFELGGRDYLTSGVSTTTTPVNVKFLKSNDLNTHTIGRFLLMDIETATIKTTRQKSDKGYVSKVTLSYDVIFPQEDASDLNDLIFNLEHSHYSLLLEFFGFTYAIVRTKSNGEGFTFSHAFDKGKEKCTLTITNTNALQLLMPQ